MFFIVKNIFIEWNWLIMVVRIEVNSIIFFLKNKIISKIEFFVFNIFFKIYIKFDFLVSVVLCKWIVYYRVR